MFTNSEQILTILAIQRRKHTNMNPSYQRGSVWGEHNNQLLIDTIFRGFDIPKIYLREVRDDDGKLKMEVVDGQQRLRAIFGFYDNNFPLGEISNDLQNKELREGVYFRDLSMDTQAEFLNFPLSVTTIRDASETEIRELFLRLQEGKSLNPAEKRNAMTGNMRDFVANLASDHPVFSKTRMRNTRNAYDDLAAHVVCLEIAGGPTDIKAANLKKMYEDQANFKKTGATAKRVERVLNYMSKCLLNDVPEMNIKWGFCDLYLLISKLIDKYDISVLHDQVIGFYANFENDRTSVEEVSALLQGTSSDKDMYDYIEAFRREGALKKNIAKRHKVYMQRFLSTFPDLTPKDPTRAFSQNERVIIWRRDGEKCNQCGKSLSFMEMHADHIIPHSAGGETKISNGQCLCEPCNLKKSNK